MGCTRAVQHPEVEIQAHSSSCSVRLDGVRAVEKESELNICEGGEPGSLFSKLFLSKATWTPISKKKCFRFSNTEWPFSVACHDLL